MRVTTEAHDAGESKYALECALIPTHTSLLEIFAYIDVYDFFATVPIIATTIFYQKRVLKQVQLLCLKDNF